MELRNKILRELPEWAEEIPYQIKSIAVKEAHETLIKCRMKAKRTGKPQTARFKSRKEPSQSCYIPKSAIKESGVYPRLSGNSRYAESIPDEPMDSRLLYKQGRWFICIPEKVSYIKSENQGRVVALDPGVRTFLTGFAENGVFKIGDLDISRISRLCFCLDKLLGRAAKAPARQRKRMRKAAERMRWKIKDLVDELHNQSVRILVDNFDIIVLPPFKVSGMVVRNSRKIRTKSVRQMLTLSHASFAVKLKQKAEAFGKVVLSQCEAYTSKTASWTGELVHNLGGRKAIKSQGLVMDRDINGARGIFLRALADQPLFEATRTRIVNNN